MGSLLNLITVMLVISTLNEQVIEHLLGRWQNALLNKCLVYISLAIGIGEALAFRINGLKFLPADMQIEAPIWVGCLATGVVIGMGSGFIHKIAGNIGVGQPGK